MYVLLVLFLFLLFFYMYSHYLKVCEERRNREGFREIEEAFQRVKKRHPLSVSTVDKFANRLIALDRVHGKLVSIIYRDGVTWEKTFNLDEIIFSRVVRTRNPVGGSIEKISLEITLRNNEDTVEFPFFDQNLDDKSDVDQRLKKAQSWKKKIQLQISERQINNVDVAFSQ